MISALLGRIVPWLMAALAALGGLVAYALGQRAKGRSQERQQAEDRDNDRADQIRNRVERELPDRLREFDGAGYRD